MSVDTNKPPVSTASNWWKWFDIRARKAGGWAFILNRIAGLALVLYLSLHLVVLAKITQGEQAWHDFLAFTENPLIKIGEFLIIAAGIFHGLNGIRIALATFGNSAAQQKAIFYIVLIVSIALSAVFAYRLFI
jgi:succinate dehydrogenase / fumarate reductase cytochrome b subunit